MPGHLEPLSLDPAASHRLGMRAVTTRAGVGAESETWVRHYEEKLLAGTVNGRLYVVGGVPVGFVSWFAGGPVGVSVELLYASGDACSPEDYAQILSGVEQEVGPIAFVPGPLTGVSAEGEERLMRSLSFRRYGRSEMVREGDGDLSPEPPVEGERQRQVVREDLVDLARLHQRAYRDSFDRYLFLELADEEEDARREVRDILEGRWGKLLPDGSWLCEKEGRIVGAVLSVHGRIGTGALIADVIVAPELQGRGLGRRLLTTAIRSMLGAGERRIYLNVTEGNERALRLYRSLGFVRSLGPTRDWYNARRIPVAPSPDA